MDGGTITGPGDIYVIDLIPTIPIVQSDSYWISGSTGNYSIKVNLCERF
jgi:hypothetical protein